MKPVVRRYDLAFIALLMGWLMATVAQETPQESTASFESEFEDSVQRYIKASQELCASADMPQQCDFVPEGLSREGNITDIVCVWCGTIWQGPLGTAPTTRESHPNYPQLMGRIINLACQGRIKVELIFKRTDGGGCFKLDEDLRFDDLDTNEVHTRCELELPDNIENEDEAAIQGKEINCLDNDAWREIVDNKRCYTSIENNKWYKHVVEINVPEKCPQDDWPVVPAAYIDAGTEVRIASYTVESSE
jgi:hypothetical protein